MNASAAGSLALFGTSADPPTRGHRALLAGLAQHYDRVATWASDNPSKQHGAPLPLRAALLQAVVDDLGDPRVVLDQRLSSPRAIDSLERAARFWPGWELVFVVGGDLAHQIPGWVRARELLERCRLAVVPRQGWPLEPRELERLRRLGGRVELLALPVPATASSAIRQQPSPELVPAALWPELLKHNLYGLGQSPADPQP